MRKNSRLITSAIFLVLLALLSAVLLSCRDDNNSMLLLSGSRVFRIQISGLDQQDGIFDAAPAEDGSGRIWMSYSQVSVPQPGFRYVSTRIAYSDNHGLTWADSGVVNPATAETTKPAGETRDLVWEHEVSRLVYDPDDADPAKSWKILWHRYLAARTYDAVNDIWYTEPLFQYGWIELKTASSPDGSWTADQKLFAGSLYDSSYNDLVSPTSPAPIRLDTLNLALSGCLAFTEPGVLAVSDGLYISLKCATGSIGKIVLLQCTHDFSSCNYLVDLISDTEASNYGDYNGFSASELVQTGGQTYLIATPTKNDAYRGCLVFTIENLTTATPSLKKTGGIADVKLTVSGNPNNHNGACGYTAGLTKSGIIYSEFFLGQTPEFRLFGSGKKL